MKKMFGYMMPLVVVMLLVVLPGIVFGQNPGDNPDAEPQAVPLDPKMTILLIAAGMFLAVSVMKRAVKLAASQVIPAKA
ncbi:hypothetical protein ACQ33O_13670 [Ferruginibacter sp. SUN002]|uniref:hypothetical protein n=1 Tax=Ferruginibacter sp. SUN002 TaxID=2937789 RepID=UPI003D36CED8